MTSTTALILLIIIPLVAAPIIYLSGRIAIKTSQPNGLHISRWLGVATLAAMFVPLYKLILSLPVEGNVNLTVGTIRLEYDGISQLVAVTLMVLCFCIMLYSVKYMKGEAGEEKFYSMLCITISMIIGMVSTTDLFNLWVWFEAMSIASYMLVAFYRDQVDSIEAGVKYLVQSATGTVFLSLGIAVVYAHAGTLDMGQLRAIITSGEQHVLVLASSALFFIGFGIKAAIVPMHTWLPDAHSQAPSGISALLSGIVIEAGLVAMLRVFASLVHSNITWGAIFMVAGGINLLVGNLMALRQTQTKRLLAYSSISQIGYILIGFGVAIYTLQPNGAAGGFFHIFTHALMKGLAFLAVGALMYVLRMSNGDHQPLLNEDLDGVAQKFPFTAFALAAAVLGLGGLPPLAGFWSKWQIFLSGFEGGLALPMVLVIFAALNSVLSLGYYAPLVNRMYRHKPGPLVETSQPMPMTLVIPLIIALGFIIVIGIWPASVEWLINPAVASFIASFGG